MLKNTQIGRLIISPIFNGFKLFFNTLSFTFLSRFSVLSFYGGAKIAGVELPLGTWPTLAIFAGVWAVVMPVLHGFAKLYRTQYEQNLRSRQSAWRLASAGTAPRREPGRRGPKTLRPEAGLLRKVAYGLRHCPLHLVSPSPRVSTAWRTLPRHEPDHCPHPTAQRTRDQLQHLRSLLLPAGSDAARRHWRAAALHRHRWLGWRGHAPPGRRLVHRTRSRHHALHHLRTTPADLPRVRTRRRRMPGRTARHCSGLSLAERATGHSTMKKTGLAPMPIR